MKQLSVITVTYNAKSTIERTLRSVEHQTACNIIEHVIIDGASSDGTLDLLDAYYQKNKDRYPIVVKSEPDKGLYDAMNKGLSAATGQFVVFLNSGDVFHEPTTVEQVFKHDVSNVGVIYGYTDVVDDEGKFLAKRFLTPPKHLTWKSFKDGMLVCHQSFYARRTLCPSYNMTYRFSADIDWCINVMKAGNIAHMENLNTNIVLTDYLNEGLTTKNHKASLIERFNIMKHHYGLFTTILHHIKFVFRALGRRIKKL
ncbi:MAG: glycosyltransferase [Bacteroidaceae bacterium]|nr:glycosyltransferase [Bacteroidaceae bacterium]